MHRSVRNLFSNLRRSLPFVWFILFIGCAQHLYTPPTIVLPKSQNTATVRTKILQSLKRTGWIVEKNWAKTNQARAQRKTDIARVNIHYNNKNVNIKYHSSENLKYTMRDGGEAVIHRRYNGWVRLLERDLKRNLSGYSTSISSSKPRRSSGTPAGSSNSSFGSSSSTSKSTNTPTPAAKAPSAPSASSSVPNAPTKKGRGTPAPPKASKQKSGSEKGSGRGAIIEEDDFYY